MGVWSVILNVLKRICASTRCILKEVGKLSDAFEMHTEIKQGASSSVILFIAFSFNYKKSGYMIINGSNVDIKCDLKIESGFLTYRKSQKYLGGVIKDDVSSFLAEKNKHVFVKLANFINGNKYAAIMVTLKVK